MSRVHRLPLSVHLLNTKSRCAHSFSRYFSKSCCCSSTLHSSRNVDPGVSTRAVFACVCRDTGTSAAEQPSGPSGLGDQHEVCSLRHGSNCRAAPGMQEGGRKEEQHHCVRAQPADAWGGHASKEQLCCSLPLKQARKPMRHAVRLKVGCECSLLQSHLACPLIQQV